MLLKLKGDVDVALLTPKRGQTGSVKDSKNTWMDFLLSFPQSRAQYTVATPTTSGVNTMITEPSQHERIQADSILTCREVCSRVGMSRTHVHNLIAKGQFPKPFKLYEGGRNNGWLASEIDQWVSTRAKARFNADAE